MAEQLDFEIIDAVPGIKRAFHVFTPALMHRTENPNSVIPCMALRSSAHEYKKMRLYNRIECMGPSALEPLFGNPLPGTGGRGVAIMFTEFPLRVWYPSGRRPPTIETPDGRNPKDILQEVITLHELAYIEDF